MLCWTKEPDSKGTLQQSTCVMVLDWTEVQRSLVAWGLQLGEVG